ncbi:MAG: hypothetical protein QHH07_12690, partial [Sedimentisphaerales bacterium]|nr:hypothetical protein [Sedimentisphaerales bacterium]
IQGGPVAMMTNREAKGLVLVIGLVLVVLDGKLYSWPQAPLIMLMPYGKGSGFHVLSWGDG